MRTRTLTAPLVWLAIALAGCGATHDDATTTPQTTAVAAGPDPCSLLPRHALAVALGSSAPTAKRTGPTCTYVTGPRSIQVQATTATAENRRSMAAAPPHATAIAGPGVHGYASSVPQVSGGVSDQAQVSLVAADAFVRIVITDPGHGEASLVRRVAALGHAAAASL